MTLLVNYFYLIFITRITLKELSSALRNVGLFTITLSFLPSSFSLLPSPFFFLPSPLSSLLSPLPLSPRRMTGSSRQRRDFIGCDEMDPVIRRGDKGRGERGGRVIVNRPTLRSADDNSLSVIRVIHTKLKMIS
jgi:hypothetical protein